jgi:hypothetical protein
MQRQVPHSAVERGPQSLPVEAWLAEAELGRSKREEGTSGAAAFADTLKGGSLLAAGVLLALLAVFTGIVAAYQLRGWPHTRTIFAVLAIAAVLMAVGAWLAFEFSDAAGLGTSVEWAPDSPP